MVVLTYEDGPETSPLCGEPSLPLGTIVEAREGSTGDESETETLPDPSIPLPPLPTSYSLLKRDQTVEVSLGGGEDREDDSVEKKATDNEDLQSWQNHPDVDGGWGWVVLISNFCIFIISSGMLSTNGMYYVQMLEEYGHSRSYTAWMGSLLNAFYMLGGPVSAIFIKRYGCRPSILVGAVIMSVGYLLSALTTSLEALFFTYGVIVACGMNFSYSGQIIALAQYFDRKQSIATSIAMIGIGVGMLLLGPWVEYNVQEYGWRGSFIWNAGVSLNIAVFGFLIFPLRPLEEIRPQHQQENEDKLGPSITFRGIPSSRSRYPFEKSMNDRSFSSLRLSLGAGYLSHSVLSLSERRGSHHYDPSIRSNQHSFCSRGSHFAIGSIRSNGASLCGRDSHADLGHCDLPHHQHHHHHHHNPLNTDPGLTSNIHSFSSRRDSQLGLGGIMSNPQSFCRASQLEFPYPLYLDREVESLKSGGRPKFLVREGECDLSCCMEEEEDSPTFVGYGERRSVCQLVVQKVKFFAYSFKNTCSGLKEASDNPLLDWRFWLMDFAIFFAMLSTLCIFIIYKDFANSLELGDSYSMALSSLGIGDVCGRLSMGLLLSVKSLDSVLVYSLAMFFCSIDILLHMFIASKTQFVVVAFVFGLTYGSQNILIAVMPSQVFGRKKLPAVFGHILFMGGVGALLGAPLAGFIVDQTGTYDGPLLFSVVTLFLGAVLMFVCYLVNRSRRQRDQDTDDQGEEGEVAGKKKCPEEEV